MAASLASPATVSFALEPAQSRFSIRAAAYRSGDGVCLGVLGTFSGARARTIDSISGTPTHRGDGSRIWSRTLALVIAVAPGRALPPGTC